MSRKEDLWDLVYDKVTDYIDRKADDSDLRNAYYKEMSDRRWKNDHVNQLIDDIVDNIDIIEDEYCGRGRSDREALQDAIVDIVDGHFALIVLSDRSASRNLSERHYDGMRKAAELYEDLCNSNKRRSRGGRREERDDRRRDDRDEYGGRSRRRDDDDRRDDYGSRREERRSERKSSGSVNDPWAVLQELEAGFEKEVTNQDEEQPRERRDDPVEVTPSVRERAPEPVQERRIRNVEGPDFTRADPYGEYIQDGEHWLVSHRSNWTVTDQEGYEHDPLARYQPEVWHDLNRFVKYHVKGTDGHVREELIPVSEDKIYLNQELAVQRGETPPENKATGGISLRQMRAGVDLNVDETAAPVAAPRTVSLITQLKKATEIIPTVGDSQAVDTLQAITFAARSRTLKNGEDVGVHLGHIRTPLNATSWEQLNLIDEVRAAPTLAAAADKMIELQPKFDANIWDALNKRFSTLVIRALTYQFQFSAIKGMNFAKDYNRALGVVANARGDEFASLFGDRTRYLNKVACAFASVEDIGDLVGDLTPVGAEYPTVVFLDFAEVISLVATLQELGLDSLTDPKLASTGASVSHQQNKQLMPSLLSLHETMVRSLSATVRARMLLSTADNYLVEIIPYAARTDSFVLTIVN